jgi:hypothetical protein
VIFRLRSIEFSILSGELVLRKLASIEEVRAPEEAAESAEAKEAARALAAETFPSPGPGVPEFEDPKWNCWIRFLEFPPRNIPISLNSVLLR